MVVKAGKCAAHYWIIESPNGPTSVGTCQYCGARRVMVNSVRGLNNLCGIPIKKTTDTPSNNW